jgi:hypothetical protein
MLQFVQLPQAVLDVSISRQLHEVLFMNSHWEG